MTNIIPTLQFMWTVAVVTAQDYYYQPHNVTRTTLSGLAAYRSALTLDWLAAEDSRQRGLVSAFETEVPPARFVSTDCVEYPRPTTGKVARLMLELLKHLEGDDGVVISELVQVLIRTKLLMETSFLEAEPDFDALMKTPDMMVGEPHATFPRIVAAVWMMVTDPARTRKYGWCPVKQLNKYLHVAKRRDIAKHMKALEAIVARARFVMEEFIQNITPFNMYEGKTRIKNSPKRANVSKERETGKKPAVRRMEPVHQLAVVQPSRSTPLEEITMASTNIIGGSIPLSNRGGVTVCKHILSVVCFVINFL